VSPLGEELNTKKGNLEVRGQVYFATYLILKDQENGSKYRWWFYRGV